MEIGALTGGGAALLRRHVVFVLMLMAGITLRILFAVAYHPAFWFTDSTMYVDLGSKVGQTSVHGPMYPAYLHMISWIGGDFWITAVQHFLIVCVCCVLYVALTRRKVRPWLAALACFPLLMGGQEIVLEHYILTEAVFTTLAITAVALLIWFERPRSTVYAIAGLLLGLAALGRTTSLAMAGVILVLALIRRVGWRPLVAFTIATAVPVVANTVFWKPATWEEYDLQHGPSRYLFSRLAQIADCSKLSLTPAERTLCPPEPLGQRPDRGDHYLWNSFLEDRPSSDNGLISAFDKKVLTQQLPDFAWLVAFDTSRFLVPGQHVGPGTQCLENFWYAPRGKIDSPPDVCDPLLASPLGFSDSPADPEVRAKHPALRLFLSRYSHHANVPVAINGLCLLLVGAAVVRRRRSPLVAESVLALALALSAIVISMALAMYDPRFGIPTAVLFTVAGALAGHALSARPPRRRSSLTGAVETGMQNDRQHRSDRADALSQ